MAKYVVTNFKTAPQGSIRAVMVCTSIYIASVSTTGTPLANDKIKDSGILRDGSGFIGYINRVNVNT